MPIKKRNFVKSIKLNKQRKLTLLPLKDYGMTKENK